MPGRWRPGPVGGLGKRGLCGVARPRKGRRGARGNAGRSRAPPSTVRADRTQSLLDNLHEFSSNAVTPQLCPVGPTDRVWSAPALQRVRLPRELDTRLRSHTCLSFLPPLKKVLAWFSGVYYITCLTERKGNIFYFKNRPQSHSLFTEDPRTAGSVQSGLFDRELGAPCKTHPRDCAVQCPLLAAPEGWVVRTCGSEHGCTPRSGPQTNQRGWRPRHGAHGHPHGPVPESDLPWPLAFVTCPPDLHSGLLAVWGGGGVVTTGHFSVCLLSVLSK